MLRHDFEWDDEKAHANERKHGVSFDEAKTCFYDVFAIETYDVIHSAGEDRFVIMGRSNRDRIIVTAFTVRDMTIRIISAREAMRHERVEYEKQNP